MILRKPYAFFIKYFRLINFMLVLLMIYFIYKMNLLHEVLSDIYLNKLTNFSALDSTYLGFKMYGVLILIYIFLSVLLLTLKRKKKPFLDYLFNIIYNSILVLYFISVNSLFTTLNEEIVEVATLKVYEDISLLFIFPLIYFIVKYLLIVIGFDLKKFDFAKDIVELKQDENDNEEVEIIFGKNNYKIKRKIRKTFREMKYYFLENKMIIGLISLIVVCIGFIGLFSLNLFTNNKVKLNKNFDVGNMTFRVNSVYETIYDYSNKMVREGYKYVIVNISITNNYFEAQKVDFKRLRLFYGKEYVYANNFNNEYFNDLGIPYNKELLAPRQAYNYIFIFKVPDSYKSNKYEFKFYSGLATTKNGTIGSYKTLDCKANNLDKSAKILNQKLQENVILNKKKFGSSNITLKSFSLEKSYKYNDGTKDVVIYDKDVNNILLILDYKLELDEKSKFYELIKNNKSFFTNYSSLAVTQNEKTKIYSNLNVLKVYDGKVFISVPYKVFDADKINFILNFRDTKIVYELN